MGRLLTNIETTTEIDALPDCDICQQLGEKPVHVALYNGKTLLGPWAFMCENHFRNLGTGLGIGYGQKLVLREKAAPPKATKKAPSIATLERWMEVGVAKATDGCRVEPDGYCEHNKPSWLLELGLI